MSSQLLQELRRGAKKADIVQILFHRSSKFLTCTSTLDAIHIFELFESIKAIDEAEYNGYLDKTPADEIGYKDDGIALDPNVKNKTAKYLGYRINHRLAVLGSLFSNYFKSHWSMAKVKIKEGIKHCAFAEKNHLIGIITIQ